MNEPIIFGRSKHDRAAADARQRQTWKKDAETGLYKPTSFSYEKDVSDQAGADSEMWNAVADEIKSGSYNKRYTPWQVTLNVQLYAGGEHFQKVMYFVRQQDPFRAATLAEMLWRAWEKDPHYPKAARYPDVTNKATVIRLLDSDWRDFLRFAVRQGKSQLVYVRQRSDSKPDSALAWTLIGQVMDPPKSSDPVSHFNREGVNT